MDGINRFVVNGIDSFVPDSIMLKEEVVQYGLRSGDGTWINIRDHRPFDEAKVEKAGNALVAYRLADAALKNVVSVNRSIAKRRAQEALMKAMTESLNGPAFVRIVPTIVMKEGVEVQFKTVNLYNPTADGASPYATMSVVRESPKFEHMFALPVGDEKPVWVVMTRYTAPEETLTFNEQIMKDMAEKEAAKAVVPVEA